MLVVVFEQFAKKKTPRNEENRQMNSFKIKPKNSIYFQIQSDKQETLLSCTKTDMENLAFCFKITERDIELFTLKSLIVLGDEERNITICFIPP